MNIKRTNDKKGWLIPYLLGLDSLFFKRWAYWTKICISDQLLPDPIPLIGFQPSYIYKERQVSRNLRRCLDYTRSVANPLAAFVDWLLWGLNQGETFPPISAKEDDFWYRTFNLGLFYTEPADHWSELASEYMGRNNPAGFFATPGSVVEMIVRMTFGSDPKHEHKIMSVCDPCCGTGGMRWIPSNYSLNLYGMDISHLLTKIARVNGFIYVPWLVYRPRHLSIFDRIKQPELEGPEVEQPMVELSAIEQPAVGELELPTGVKIPRCNICGDDQHSFLMDIQTGHQLTVSHGLLTVDNPDLSRNLITRKLRPENISCAKCFNKLRKEGP